MIDAIWLGTTIGTALALLWTAIQESRWHKYCKICPYKLAIEAQQQNSNRANENANPKAI